MVDSTVNSASFKNQYDFSEKSSKLIAEKIVKSFQADGQLSDAEIKFLSLSKEKRSSSELMENIFNSVLTLNNYEELFCLEQFTAFGGTVNPNQAVRNIRYKDKNGTIVATVQIDTISKKIRMQNLGDILPKQECFTPSQVGTKLHKLAQFKKWTTEDGGANLFNGNKELRYKDENKNVMAAVITKDNGVYDTIVEYEYRNGLRTKMVLTNNFGNSIVVYDNTSNVNQIIRLDIDNDGTIIEITKVYAE